MKICFISLGCDKNLVDTEMMMGMLSENGHELVSDETEADVAVVNTCSFISDAKAESINTLIKMERLKENGTLKGIIAAGCLAERYSEDIRRELPGVDVLIGTMAIDEIVNAVTLIEKGITGKTAETSDKKHMFFKPVSGALVYGKKRIVSTGGHFAYLKIAEGCDKHCTYCAIPSFRGKFRSVPMEVLVNEAKTLCEGGVKELILVAQETTLYGKDLYGEKSLVKLLRELSKIEGIVMIRLLYCYPEEITDELIAEIASNRKICKYIDMPIQHASDRILKRMGRLTTGDDLRFVIKRLRDNVPDICIRTTLITGFPGETKKDFDELVSFVKDIRFDRLGVFTYSKEEGTGAALMKRQVPNFIKKARKNKIMRIQQAIAFENAASEVGRELTVMVEGKLPDESEDGKNVYACRTYKDAPDVDGFLFLNTARELVTGDICTARVTGANNYDLVGVMNDEFTE
ncbi:MAG: 30S ribosomal protein S12 methylthiotransferase RimO [Lachnospiraceae bacterium]|nr:30S ribosomal protein S12 methylthiotransferase RimO [Lachnospiraceae bacterium]